MKDFLSQAGELLKKRKQYKRQTAVFLCLAVIVAFGTVTALKLYGQAMTHKVDVLACSYEVHEHTEDCYEEDAEGSRKLVCGYADYVIHVHNDSCYDAEGNLVCALEEHEEHKHTEDCYKTERILVCGEETESGSDESAAGASAQSAEGMAGSDAAAGPESSEEPDGFRQQNETVCGKEAHKHDESCYEKNLVCGKEEHTHDESCMHHELNCELAEHAHDAGCYDEAGNVVCGQEEHAHEIGCYDAEGNLICKQEHEHFAGCYINTFECGKENHTHADECYEESLACEMEEHEHTDACFAQAGAESAASTKSVSAEEEGAASAEPAGHVHTDACYEEVTTLVCGELELHTHDDSCYTEDCFDEEGDLIEGSRPSCGLLQLEEHTHTKDCFKTVELTPEEVAALNNGAKLHVHTDECYDEEGKLICGHEETHIHDASCYDEDGNVICGHNLQTEPENEKTCEGSGYSVKVTYPDSAKIPEEAELIVRQITEESDPERFAQRQAEARETLENENISVHALFDIGFYVDGQEIEPKDTVNVTIQLLDENGLPEGTPMQIVHFAESGNEVLESGDIDSEGNASFETDSFSEFMMVSAFGSGNIAIITTDGPESDEVDGNLICGKEEHTHGEECNGADGNLICGKEEHTHDLTCLEEKAREEVEKVNELIAALPDQEEIARKTAEYEEEGEEGEEALGEYTEALLVQIQEAYDAYLGLDEALREYVTGADYLLAIAEMMGVSLMDETSKPDDVPEHEAFVPIGEQGDKPSGMVLELLYGDETGHNDKVNGVEDYTYNMMQGCFVLTPYNLPGRDKIDRLTMLLYFPKEYIENNISISMTNVPGNTEGGNKIDEETIDGVEYYKVSVTFTNYMPSSAFKGFFHMKFKTAEVPKNYKLCIFGTIKCEGREDSTAENIYRPKYDEPKIVKYVNTNKFENMSGKDGDEEVGVKVTAAIGEDDALADDQYVSFWYKLGNAPANLRGYETITLTDKLPLYKKKGVEELVYAKFDSDANPGWILSEDGKTVSRTFAVKTSDNWSVEEYDNKLMLEIEKAELKLQFPGCVMDEKDNEGHRMKKLRNEVEAVCTPENNSETEEGEDKSQDDVHFILIEEPGPEGSFGKRNSIPTIMDTKENRESDYMWTLEFTNKASSPLVNIVMEDEKIDDRLKFRSIIFRNIVYDGKNLIEYLDHVDAYYAENDYDIYVPEGDNQYEGANVYKGCFKDLGVQGKPYNADTFKLEFDSSKVYTHFRIYFKGEFELKSGEAITVWPFSTFKEPENEQYDLNDEKKNTYWNYACVKYWEKIGGKEEILLEDANSFELIGTRENIWIEKTMGDSMLHYPEIKSDGTVEYKSGTSFTRCTIDVRGVLDPTKEYDDLCVIDLLPEGLNFLETENIGGDDKDIINRIEVVENFKKSGRKAVIFYLDAEEAKLRLRKLKLNFNFAVGVKPTASPGNYDNDAYLASKDFELPSVDHGWTMDKYEIEGKGVDHEIRWSNAAITIAAPDGVYAEKYIAREDTEEWSKTGLRLKTGAEFQYKLKITNTKEERRTGLIVFDVLPRIGDRSINGEVGRDSEFTVNLSKAINPGEYFNVLYTTSSEVYGEGKDMESILENSDVTWVPGEEVANWNEVTAFKIEAQGSFGLDRNESIEFRIPVKVTNSLPENYKEILAGKEAEDMNTGTVVYLDAFNSFGYKINPFGSAKNMESNYVKAQIPFAGFIVQKTDENKNLLPGAVFKLEDAERKEIATVTSDEKGKVSFQYLTEGTYYLTETKAPNGYKVLADPIEVTITLNETTMEYTVSAKNLTGKGTNNDPFVVVNETSYELPETGGIGSKLYTMAGAAFITLGAGFLYKKKFRERRA